MDNNKPQSIKKCDCISYNQPRDYQKTPSIKISILTSVLPNGSKQYKDVMIDACIKDEIQLLWDNSISTLSSCCGHNGEFPRSIVINSKNDAQKAKELLPHFEICYWDLIKI